MTLFVACIDLHNGQVKQIVGSSLTTESAITNYTCPHPPSYYASLYKSHNLQFSHLIMLGPGNQEAALNALQAWPFHIQVGGGITDENAKYWLEKGASKVIVTSYLFPNAQFDIQRLEKLSQLISKEKLVVDLSCKRVGTDWIVAMNKWQTLTNLKISRETLDVLSQYCSEFLIHAADVEGLCQGIDTDLVKALGEWTQIPTTYAGGARHIHDLDLVKQLSNGKVNLTIGSALDIFGGQGVTLNEAVEWNKKQQESI